MNIINVVCRYAGSAELAYSINFDPENPKHIMKLVWPKYSNVAFCGSHLEYF